MTFLYFIICTMSFFLVAWIMIRSLRNSNYPPNNDDDGGMSGNTDFPLIDLPPGGKYEDLFVDRWYENAPQSSKKNIK